MMHKDVEVYVDAMIIKSKEREDHWQALRCFFERISQYKLRLNPSKCTFGITSGKLLGYLLGDSAWNRGGSLVNKGHDGYDTPLELRRKFELS